MKNNLLFQCYHFLMGHDSGVCILCNRRLPKRKMDYLYYDVGICRECIQSDIMHPKGAFITAADTLSFIIAPFQYKPAFRASILNYKFAYCHQYSHVYGHYINEYIDYFIQHEERDWIHTYDMLVPVPISEKRLAERGYNQSLLLAQIISEHTKIPVCSHALYKTVHNEHQSVMDKIEKAVNVKNTYQANASAAAGKRILLIDDICTTLSTAKECARELLSKGAQNIALLAVSYAVRKKGNDVYFRLMNIRTQWNYKYVSGTLFF